jgi:hypothetical protein
MMASGREVDPRRWKVRYGSSRQIFGVPYRVIASRTASIPKSALRLFDRRQSVYCYRPSKL